MFSSLRERHSASAIVAIQAPPVGSILGWVTALEINFFSSLNAIANVYEYMTFTVLPDVVFSFRFFSKVRGRIKPVSLLYLTNL